MHSLMYGVGAVDFTAFSAVAAVLLVSALLACYVPALRASNVDPMQPCARNSIVLVSDRHPPSNPTNPELAHHCQGFC
jgi:hypothetical protein